MKPFEQHNKRVRHISLETGSHVLHALGFALLYFVFGVLLHTQGYGFTLTSGGGPLTTPELIGLALYVLPLVFALWGYGAGMLLVRQARKGRAADAPDHADPAPAATEPSEGGEATIFNLHECIYQCMAALPAPARHKSLQHSVNIHANVPHKVRGDADTLRTVIQGLLDNAIKYTDRGEIAVNVKTLSQSHHDLLLRFEIVDTGVGMSPEVQARILDVCAGKDVGHGLARCLSLIDTMGGRLGVSSRQRQGSAFWFTAILQKAHGAELAA